LIYFTKLFPDYFYLRFKKNRPTRQDKPKTAGGTIADNHLKFQGEAAQQKDLPTHHAPTGPNSKDS